MVIITNLPETKQTRMHVTWKNRKKKERIPEIIREIIKGDIAFSAINNETKHFVFNLVRSEGVGGGGVSIRFKHGLTRSQTKANSNTNAKRCGDQHSFLFHF